VVGALDAATAAALTSVIVSMARPVAPHAGLADRDSESVAALPKGWEESPECLETGMTLYGILGIKDPLREVRSMMGGGGQRHTALGARGGPAAHACPRPPAGRAQSIAKVQGAGLTVAHGDGSDVISGDGHRRGVRHPPQGRRRAGGAKLPVRPADAREALLYPSDRPRHPPRPQSYDPRATRRAAADPRRARRSSPKDKNILVRRLNGERIPSIPPLPRPSCHAAAAARRNAPEDAG